jgi:transposase
MGESRGKFDKDFREGAVRLVRETGKPIAQVARDLGINEGTLGYWVGADWRRQDGGDGQLNEDERAELARLGRENAELTMERDVLKRSAALWVKDAMGSRLAVACFIASQRDAHGVPRGVSCRALGCPSHGSTSGSKESSKPRSPGCSPNVRARTGRRGSPPRCGMRGGESQRTRSRA